MKNIVIYVHGKGGNIEEADHYKQFFNSDFDIVGFDYKSETPWEAKNEFSEFFDKKTSKYDKIILIANSIGAYFSMLSLADQRISKAMFVSPIIDMERLILNMMDWTHITESDLKEQKVIDTTFGESISWEYLSYVRKHPIKWNIPTEILCAENDEMTSVDTMIEFANKINAKISIIKDGEHWFHKEEQIAFLDKWFMERI